MLSFLVIWTVPASVLLPLASESFRGGFASCSMAKATIQGQMYLTVSPASTPSLLSETITPSLWFSELGELSAKMEAAWFLYLAAGAPLSLWAHSLWHLINSARTKPVDFYTFSYSGWLPQWQQSQPCCWWSGSPVAAGGSAAAQAEAWSVQAGQSSCSHLVHLVSTKCILCKKH